MDFEFRISRWESWFLGITIFRILLVASIKYMGNTSLLLFDAVQININIGRNHRTPQWLTGVTVLIDIYIQNTYIFRKVGFTALPTLSDLKKLHILTKKKKIRGFNMETNQCKIVYSIGLLRLLMNILILRRWFY